MLFALETQRERENLSWVKHIPPQVIALAIPSAQNTLPWDTCIDSSLKPPPKCHLTQSSLTIFYQPATHFCITPVLLLCFNFLPNLLPTSHILYIYLCNYFCLFSLECIPGEQELCLLHYCIPSIISMAYNMYSDFFLRK